MILCVDGSGNGIDRLSANGERERFTPDVSADYGRHVSDVNSAASQNDRHLDIAVTSSE